MTFRKSEIFPAEHTAFYAKFDPWRKEMSMTDLPRSGVYILKAKKKICRLLGEDTEGMLYIGKGIILEYNNRVGKFINALNNTEDSHRGGHRFNMERIIIKYPLSESEIEVVLDENPEKMEAIKLDEYLRKFGELPPFNRREESI